MLLVGGLCFEYLGSRQSPASSNAHAYRNGTPVPVEARWKKRDQQWSSDISKELEPSWAIHSVNVYEMFVSPNHILGFHSVNLV